MTFSAKLGAEFPDDCARAGLSDAAFRTHVEAITWLCAGETFALRIPKHLVRRFAGSDDLDQAVKELTALGFWRDGGDAYVLVHHADVVRGCIVSQQKFRQRNRRAQQAWRARQG